MDGKVCRKCDELKPWSDFDRKKDAKDGHNARCKSCRRAAARAAYAADPEPAKARSRAALQGPQRDRLLAQGRARGRAWNAENPERRRVKLARWRADNPERARLLDQRRKAQQRAAFFEDVDLATVWSRDNGVCHLCGLPADASDWHLEHVIPLALGGAHSFQNTAVSHPACNLAKSDRLIPSALGRLGSYSVRPASC